MRTIRLNIGGPKGNAWYIMGTVRELCRQLGHAAGYDEVVTSKMRGDSFVKLGGQGNDYETLLRVYLKEFPFVELYATHDIGINPELYTLDEDPQVYEL